MSETFEMFPPTTSENTDTSTCSPASADGPTPSASRDGPMIAPSGPAPVPVSRFRARDSEKAMPTSDTSGPLFNASSPSTSLQLCLESRLRARMDVNGSLEYALIWSTWDMPSGPPICRLRASARRTSGNDFGGWPTLDTGTGPHGHRGASSNPSHQSARDLQATAAAAGRAAPTARDMRSEYGTPEMMERRQMRPQGKPLSKQVLGATASSSPAATEKRGALNPAFSLWLMGYNPLWIVCAPVRKKRGRR